MTSATVLPTKPVWTTYFAYIEGDMDVDDPLEESKMENGHVFNTRTWVVSCVEDCCVGLT